MSPGETGLETLMDAGQVGDVPHFPEVESWADVKGMIQQLIDGEHQHKTLVIDTMNGLEALMIRDVCAEHFGGEMVNYNAFGSGSKVSNPEWVGFLGLLDRLREKRRMSIIGLCHAKPKLQNNPGGVDYDRWQPTFLTDTIWDKTYGWFDTVMFGTFDTIVKGDSPKATKGKAKGGVQRSMYIGPNAGWYSGSRYALPDSIDMGESGKEAWDNFAAEMKAARLKKGAAE